jgi:hypothetical protein
MAYQSLIDSSLAKAYRLAKDLADSVTFTKKSGEFNFSTMDVVSADTSVVVKTIVTDGKQAKEDRSVKVKQLMFRSKDLGDISLFDTVVIKGETWKLGNVIKDSGYIIIAEAYRE